MTLDDLEQLLDRYGSQPGSWPTELRQTALVLISRSTDAQQLLDHYSDSEHKLDRLLDLLASQETVPEFPGLEVKVMHQQLPERSRPLIDSLLDWLLPKSGFTGSKLWRPVVAACLPLLFGMLLSNVFSFGIDSNLNNIENWDDELYLLSLNDYVETVL